MKALEILKTINRRYCTDSVCGKLDLAIKELEEFNNRSCESCKYSKFYKLSGTTFCNNEKSLIGFRQCDIELEVKGNSMQLEVGEYYLSASGEIIKIVHYDKYGFRFEDENVNYYKEDGVIYGDCREFDLIAHIPKELYLHILNEINIYYTDSILKSIVDNVYK